MLNIGCHISIADGLYGLEKGALRVGANTMQFFIRNPRGGQVRYFDIDERNHFIDFLKNNNFAKFVVHAPYTLNLCAKDEKIRAFTKNAMIEDIKILNHIPGNYYNFHPGFHVGIGSEKGIEMIVTALEDILKASVKTTVLLETMSGKGSEIGYRFEEIAQIINSVKHSENLGVCLDTCHIFAAGYDIVNDLDYVVEQFDNIIGLDRLCAVHLNDSMMPFGSHKDRHAKIGFGEIGSETLVKLITHPKLKHLPFILETPNDEEGYAKEIKFLRIAADGKK